MRTALAGLASTSILSVLLSAGCGATGPRPLSPRTAYALPESDPTSRGTVQGALFLTEAEQVVVRMGRDPEGRVVVLQVLSPVLTPDQQEEVRRAFALGDWKRKTPAPAEAESWVETIVRNRP